MFKINNKGVFIVNFEHISLRVETNLENLENLEKTVLFVNISNFWKTQGILLRLIF